MNAQSIAHAELLCSRGQHREALQIADRGLQQDPQDSEAHALRSLCLAGMGQFEASIGAARAAISISPATANAHYALALVALRRSGESTDVGIARITYTPDQRNHLGEAARAIAQALHLSPHSVHFLTLRARILAMQGQIPEAIATMNHAVSLAPDGAEPNALLAQLLLISGKKDEAAELIKRALSYAPDSPYLHFMQGNFYLQTSRPKLASAAFLEAIRLDPRPEEFRAALLEALRQRNPLYRLPLKCYLPFARRFGIVPALLIVVLAIGVQPRLLPLMGISNTRPLLLAMLLGAGLLVPLFSPPIVGNYLVQFRPAGFRALSRREFVTANALVAWWVAYLTALFFANTRPLVIAALAGAAVFAASGLLAATMSALFRPRPLRSPG